MLAIANPVAKSTAATQAGVASPALPQPRLVRAAHEFEAQLMKELLRPMTAGSALTGEDDADGGGTGPLGEFASESLAGALSAGGGLGIANRIVRDLSRSGNLPENSAVIRNVQIDTGISLRK